VLALAKGKSALFTDGRYTVQAREEVKGARVVIGKKAAQLEAVDWLAKQLRGKAVCGIEAEHLSYASYESLRHAMPARLRLKPTHQYVERLRMIKDAAELSRIRAAASLANDVFEAILPDVKSGVPESKLAAEIEFMCRRMGAEAMSFETIVAGGKRSALPHGVASEQKLPQNGFVIFDFGVKLAGYCSDMTRTVHLGAPNARARRVYAAVKASQEAGIKAVKAGALTSEVDQACRKTLEKHSLARYFTHSTGHGVGLEIHEPPGLRALPGTKKKAAKRVRKGRISGSPQGSQPERLEAGMVVTVEPGVYIPGFGGVRIEDLVIVTATGCEVLSRPSKDLLIL